MSMQQVDMFNELMPIETIQERARQIRLPARDLARMAHCNENTLGHAFAGKSRLQRATHQLIQAALTREELRLFQHLKRVLADDGALGIAAIAWAAALPFLLMELS
jgi:hypothetical protein